MTERQATNTSRTIAFLVPGDPARRTGGYIYDRRMVEGLRQRGWSVDVLRLDDSFPRPTPAALRHAGEVFATIATGTRIVIDGLACGAMPDLVEHEAARLRTAALVHLPLGADIAGVGRPADQVIDDERRALRAAAVVICTGADTVRFLTGIGIPPDRLLVVEPGTDRPPLERPRHDRLPTVLSVATLHRGKGHDILLPAFAALPDARWRLVCAGSVTRDPVTAGQVRATIRRLGLDERVSLAGELDDEALAACYRAADVFALATLQETFGMAVAEALSYGLPIVATRTGAIPDLVRDEAGVVVPPGDAAAFAAALAKVCGDAELRARLAEGARRACVRLRTWDQAVDEMTRALGRM